MFVCSDVACLNAYVCLCLLDSLLYGLLIVTPLWLLIVLLLLFRLFYMCLVVVALAYCCDFCLCFVTLFYLIVV